LNQPIKNKNCLWRPCLLMNRDEMSNLHRDQGSFLPNFGSFGKTDSEEKWQPCLLTDRDEMSNLYRGPSIDASYQVSVHLAKQFQRRRFFRNQLIRNKNCLWWPFLLTDRDEMSNLYRGPSIDASYHVSVHLAKRFQRRRFKNIVQSETRISCGGHVC
jgi:hypothetical protein